MDKRKEFKILIFGVMVLIISIIPGVALAQGETPSAPPAAGANASQSPDVTQFENWLKSNNTTASAQPSATDSNIPPPPFISNSAENPSPQNKPVISVTKSNGNSPVIASKPLTYEESKEVMLSMAPKVPRASGESTEAFNGMMQQNMPLTPQQVVQLRQLIDSSQRAAAIPATVPPKPVSSTIMVNLAPGATPPAIRLAQGYVSSLVFVDSTGAPWPIAAYDIGDPKAVNIQWDSKSNVILIQAVSPYGDSNFVVRLAGLTTPITLELVSGQRVVDFRADIHVSGLGPNSKDLPVGVGIPANANQLLLNVLDGVAPAGAKQLTVKGGDCQAWVLGEKMYLRSRLTLLSPGWLGRMVSPDGMNAYEIQKSSAILVSQYGEPIELKIEGL